MNRNDKDLVQFVTERGRIDMFVNGIQVLILPRFTKSIHSVQASPLKDGAKLFG